MPDRLRSFHRLSAITLSAFFIAHIANHLTGLNGQAEHIALMDILRSVYRHPLAEPLLLVLVTWQAVSGLTLLWRARRNTRNSLGWLQHLTGLYLSLFLLIHVSAVVAGRVIFGLDTDFRFAAAGFHVGGWIWFFAPYYFLAVFSLFAHSGCGLYWNLPQHPAALRPAVLGFMIIAGLAAASAIVLMLAGALYPVDIPAAYRATYG